MDTIDFLVKFMPKGQSGGGGSTDGSGNIATDAIGNVVSGSVSTGDFAILALIVAAIVAIGAVLSFAYLKMRRTVTSSASHVRPSVHDINGSANSRKIFLFLASFVALVCLACALAFSSVKNAKADDVEKDFTASDVVYVYDETNEDTDLLSWTWELASISNNTMYDASVTNLAVEKLDGADDKDIIWDFNDWYTGNVESSISVPITDKSASIPKNDDIYFDVTSEYLTNDIAESLAGKDLFKITLTVESLGIYKNDALEALDASATEAIGQINELTELTDAERQSYIDRIDVANKFGQENINNALTKEQVSQVLAASQASIQSIVDEAEAAELPKVKEKAKEQLAATVTSAKEEIDSIEGVTQDEKDAAKKTIDQIYDEAVKNIDKPETTKEEVYSTKEMAEGGIEVVVQTTKEIPLNNAKEEAKLKIENTYVTAIENINGMSGLYDADCSRYNNLLEESMQKALSSVDAAKDFDEIEQAVSEYAQEGTNTTNEANELSNVKTKRRDQIRSVYEVAKQAGLTCQELSADEKQKYLTRLETAYTRQIDLLKDAQSQSAADTAIQGFVEETKDIISTYPKVADDFKKQTKNEINNTLNANIEVVNNLRSLDPSEKNWFIEELREKANKVTWKVDQTVIIDLPQLISQYQKDQFTDVKDAALKDLSSKDSSSKAVIDDMEHLSDADRNRAKKIIDESFKEQKDYINNLDSSTTPTSQLSSAADNFNKASNTETTVFTRLNFAKYNAKTYIEKRAQDDKDIINNSEILAPEAKDEACKLIDDAKNEALAAIEAASDIQETQDAANDMNGACDEVIDKNGLSEEAKVLAYNNFTDIKQDALNMLANLSLLSDDAKEQYKNDIESKYNEKINEFESAKTSSEYTQILSDTNASFLEIIKDAATDTTYFAEQQAKDRVSNELTYLSNKDKYRYNSDISAYMQVKNDIISDLANFEDIVACANTYASEATSVVIEAEKINDTKNNAYNQIDQHYIYTESAIDNSGLTEEQKQQAHQMLDTQKQDSSDAVSDSTSVSGTDQQVANFDNVVAYIVDSDSSGKALESYKKAVADDVKSVVGSAEDIIDTQKNYLTQDQYNTYRTQITAAQNDFESKIEAADVTAYTINDAQNNLNNTINTTIQSSSKDSVDGAKNSFIDEIKKISLSQQVQDEFTVKIEAYAIFCRYSIDKSYNKESCASNFNQFVELCESIINEAKQLSDYVNSAKTQINTKVQDAIDVLETLKNLSKERVSEYIAAVNKVGNDAIAELDQVDNQYAIDAIVSQTIDYIDLHVNAAKTENEKYYISFESNNEQWGTVSPSSISNLTGETYVQENADHSLKITNGDLATLVTTTCAEDASFVKWDNLPDEKTPITKSTTLKATFEGKELDWSSLNVKLSSDDTQNIKLGNDINYDGGDIKTLTCNGTKTLDLNGHTIDGYNNETNKSCDSVITNNGNLTLDDNSDGIAGKITGGTGNIVPEYSSSLGGGVYNNGTLVMNRGTFSENKASWGGAIYNASGRKFTLNNGTITNNKSDWMGSAIHNNWGNCFLLGGQISGNNAYINNGPNSAVCWDGGNLELGGNIQIKDNYDCRTDGTSELLDNLKISSDNQNLHFTISKDTPLKDEASVGITHTLTPTKDNPVTLASNVDSDYSKYFASDKAKYEIQDINIDNVRCLVLAKKAQPETDWTKLNDDLSSVENKTIQLDKNINYDGGDIKSLTCNGIKTLDLNGYTINGHDEATNTSCDSVITNNGSLALNDSSDGATGKITGGTGNIVPEYSSSLGGGVYNNGTLVMNRGTFSENKASWGGAIYNAGGGKFTLNNGTITNNKSDWMGSAIHNNWGNCFLLGGQISGNNAYINNGPNSAVCWDGGSLELGGNIQIKDNYDCRTDGTSELLDNLKISSDSQLYFTISADTPLKDEASVGITHALTPTKDNPVILASNVDSDYSKYFASDNSNYEVAYKEINGVSCLVLAVKDQPEPAVSVKQVTQIPYIDSENNTQMVNFVPAFSNGNTFYLKNNNVEFYTDSEGKNIDTEIHNKIYSDDGCTMNDLYNLLKNGDNVKTLYAKADSDVKFYAVVDETWNDVFGSSKQGTARTVNREGHLYQNLLNNDSRCDISTIYFDGKDGEGALTDWHWSATEDEIISSRCPILDSVNYSSIGGSSGEQDTNAFLGAYGCGTGGILSKGSVFPWSSRSFDADNAYYWLSNYNTWTGEKDASRNGMGGIVLSLSFNSYYTSASDDTCACSVQEYDNSACDTFTDCQDYCFNYFQNSIFFVPDSANEDQDDSNYTTDGQTNYEDSSSDDASSDEDNVSF